MMGHINVTIKAWVIKKSADCINRQFTLITANLDCIIRETTVIASLAIIVTASTFNIL